MFKSISDQFRSILVALLSIQSVCSALAVDTNQTLNKTNSTEENQLVTRQSDEYTVVHKWNGGDVIGPAATVGLVITGTVAIVVNWYGNRPDPDKICGRSAIIDVTDNEIDYQYYVYSYTTGDSCDSSQRTKTIAETLSEAFDDMNSQGASAVCLDFDHHGTWHGVLGLATKSSGQNPQTACENHHPGAKRGNNPFLGLEETKGGNPQIDGKASTKRDEGGLVKRSSISVSQSNKQSGDAKLGHSNKSQALIAEIGGKIYSQSYNKNCAGVSGTLTDSNGVSVTYYYIGGGDENCDTTAEAKTIYRALDDAWDGLTGTSALCMTMQHGSGTWRGYLGVSTMQDTYPANHMCD